MRINTVEFLLVLSVIGGISSRANLQAHEGGSAIENSSVETLRVQARKGNAKAQFDLGRRYFLGQGVPANDSEAAKWFREAANQGNDRAKYYLLICFRKENQSHQMSQTERENWFKNIEKMSLGNVQAMVGVLYQIGDDEIQQDYIEAAKWYRKSAEQGCIMGQFCLAKSYDMGLGVPQNLIEAYVWASLAASTGSELEVKYRNQLASRLSPDSLERAQEQARQRQEALQAKRVEH